MSRLPTGIDFESKRIESRPKYPPEPVGVAIKYPGKKSKYLAWGHPTGNNTTKEAATRELKEIFASQPIVCHHAKFDLDVAETRLGIQPPDYSRLDDTMILGFLDDPHSRQLGLKPMSVRYLGRDPTERDGLKEWILASIPEAYKKKSEWGAYISEAPGDIVSPYACADTDMTVDICKFLLPKIAAAGMMTPYQRELKLIPILLENERQGIRVNLLELENDIPIYEEAIGKLDAWIRKYLGAKEELNIDADQQMADALEGAGLVKDWVYTKPDKNGKGGGKRSVSKKSLDEMVEDKLFLAALEYRSSITTFTRTFLSAWRDVARETDGWVYTTWNSTAQEEGGGTRTGRLSSSKPTNFMNIPSKDKFKKLVEKLGKAELFKKLKWLPELPSCRRYIVADTKNHVICGRDFSQQEPRTLAHFEDGGLCRAYKENPKLDVYIFAMEEMLKVTGRRVTRDDMKVIILAILYGLGSAELAKRLGIETGEAKQFKELFLSVFPGIKELNKDLRAMAKRREPMRTWGGRLYYCEEPKVVQGVLRSFEYRMINHLVQSSSADETKESIIRYDEMKKDSRLFLTVHDENEICAPKKAWKSEMLILKNAMEGLELDVKLLTDGEVGYSWGEMEACE